MRFRCFVGCAHQEDHGGLRHRRVAHMRRERLPPKAQPRQQRLGPKSSCQRSQDIDVVTHGHDDGRAAERGDLLRDCVVNRKRGQRRASLPPNSPHVKLDVTNRDARESLSEWKPYGTLEAGVLRV